MSNQLKDLTIENARIIFKNFSGRETEFNKLKNRTFNILIDDENVATSLMKDGWNVRQTKPREGDTEADIKWRLEVTARFDNYPPRIYKITKNGKELLSEETVGILDYVDILSADLIIHPSQWSMATGKSGIKAYLKTAYITVEEDPFYNKYM